jgi:metal-sulfur cluster biosynthetic enzyme
MKKENILKKVLLAIKNYMILIDFIELSLIYKVNAWKIL